MSETPMSVRLALVDRNPTKKMSTMLKSALNNMPTVPGISKARK
ncbi:hypothetical protein [Ruegeria sp. 6PALISEP08]|nr:hypothetical protein [Ruegeria sp. 6PALISEP08]